MYKQKIGILVLSVFCLVLVGSGCQESVRENAAINMVDILSNRTEQSESDINELETRISDLEYSNQDLEARISNLEYDFEDIIGYQ